MLFVIGIFILLLSGGSNNISDIIRCGTLGLALMGIYVLFSTHSEHYLVFVKPNGRHIKVRTKTLLGKLIVTHKYNKLGCTLCTEWEVSQ